MTPKLHKAAVEWTARQEKLGRLLAAGWTVKGAAAEVGISATQAHSYKHKPGFDKLVLKFRAELFAESLGQLAGRLSRAVDTLDKLLDDDKPPAVRLGAARGILADAATIRQSVELEQRLAEVEGRLAKPH